MTCREKLGDEIIGYFALKRAALSSHTTVAKSPDPLLSELPGVGLPALIAGRVAQHLHPHPKYELQLCLRAQFPIDQPLVNLCNSLVGFAVNI